MYSPHTGLLPSAGQRDAAACSCSQAQEYRSGWAALHPTVQKKAAEKKLLQCKREAYSPERIGKRLLYKARVQCKKLVWSAEGCMCKGMGAQASLYADYLDLEITALPKHNVSLAEKSVVKPKESFPLAGNNTFLCMYFSCRAGERRELRATRGGKSFPSGKAAGCGPLPSAIAELCGSSTFASAAIQSSGRETVWLCRQA